MANRKNTFLIKRSNVAGKVPAAGDLLLGELALNTADNILYASGTTAGSILPIGWDRVARTGDTMTGNLNAPSISATTITSQLIQNTTNFQLYLDSYTQIIGFNNSGYQWQFLPGGQLRIPNNILGGSYDGNQVNLSSIATLSGLRNNAVFIETGTGGTADNTFKFIGDTFYSPTVSATTYLNLPSLSGDYLPLSGGTVYGPTSYTGGLTANTLNVTGLTQTSGVTSTGGIIFPHKTITTNYTATTADYFLNISGGTLDITLMSAVGVEGKLLVVKNEGSGIVNVISQFGELIDDRTDVLLTQGNSVQLVSDGINWAILGYNISSTQANTGVIEFSGLSKVTSSTFSVAPVKGFIVDDVTNPTIPFLTYIEYTGGTHTDDYYTTAFETFVYITSGGTIGQQPTPLTTEQRRQNIFLGKLGHPDKTAINLVFSQPDYVLTPLAQLRDMFLPINLINGGVYPSANTGLTINTSGGNIYGLGINFASDVLNPNSLAISGQSPCTFQYRTSTGGTVTNTTLIDPLNYDLNGVITPLSGTKATNQRIYLLQNGSFRVMYGQHVYANFAEAVQNLQTETFTPFPNFINNAVLICVLTVLSSATDLTDTSKAQFFFASKFGETVGAAGGVSTTNLQQAYNNSTSPEIVINATLDGLTIKNGTGNADNITRLLEGQTGTNGITSFIRADGYISGTTFQSNGFIANSDGLTATTVSATTYLGLPIDVRVTGGTYSNNTFSYINNTGGTFNILFNTMTGLTVNGNLIVTGDTYTSGSSTTIGDIRAFSLVSTQSINDEGGEVRLATPQTNTTLSGGNITFDVYQNKLRFFESGGSNRGVYIDLTAAGAGVSTNLLSGGGGEINTASNLGSGTGLFAQKVSSDLQFKSLTSTGGTVTISNDTNTVNLEVVPASNFTGGTVTGPTVFTSGLSANTISATTYYNLPPDIRVTGGTYTAGTTTFTNSTGGTFSVTGYSTGGTSSLATNNIWIGDATNTPVARTMTGDVTINVSGVTTIQPNVVTYDKIQVVSQHAVLGSPNLTGGTVEEIPIIDGYVVSGDTVANLLDNATNWDIDGVYTGTTITGTYQGQSHYNSSYWFTAVNDNVWIRLIRG